MLVRKIFAGALIFGLATTGLVSDSFGQKEEKKERKARVKVVQIDEEKLDELHEKVIKQVEKALKKFEEELGEKKLDGILEKVEQALENKLNSFEFEFDGNTFDKEKLHEHLMKLGELKNLNTKELMPHVIQLQTGKKRKMLGVLLEAENDEPVKVKEVMKGGAAASAGIKSGDVIIKVNGKKVENPGSLSDKIQETKGAVKITVQRKGKDMEFKVEPKEMPGNQVTQALIELEDLTELPKELLGGNKDVIKIHKEMIEKLGKGDKAHGIFLVKPHGDHDDEDEVEEGDHKKEIKKKIEWKIDRAAENKKLLKSKAEDLHKELKHRIEIKSDLGERLEEMQKKLKALQEEIKQLKKAKGE